MNHRGCGSTGYGEAFRLEIYNALQEFGVPVEMLVHVGQGHSLTAPPSLLAKMLPTPSQKVSSSGTRLGPHEIQGAGADRREDLVCR